MVLTPQTTTARTCHCRQSGFCGQNFIHISRLPLVAPTGKAAWSILLSVLHPEARIRSRQLGTIRTKGFIFNETVKLIEGQVVNFPFDNGSVPLTKTAWDAIPVRPLRHHRSTACIAISRATLMTILALTNARPTFRYSDGSGHRAAYPSYCGQWRIEWPLGEAARIRFDAHDSHNIFQDVYPASFERRVDKCIQMMAGVVIARAPGTFKCAFPGRKPAGKWILEYHVKGFGGAHGSRHLYNMMGGKVYEVDLLLMKRLEEGVFPKTALSIILPSRDGPEDGVTLWISEAEASILNRALDYLPWSSLSWSIHRGLRDILVAFAKQRMDPYRAVFAEALHAAVHEWPERLDAMGWDPTFVREHTADMAASAVQAGRGNSGDLVRIVTDAALLLWDGTKDGLDETRFWRTQPSSPPEKSEDLSPDTVVALTKCFVLEWSNEFDYQMYHDLPLELIFG